MDEAFISDMLYPCTTYLAATTCQASQRCPRAAFKDNMWGKCPGSQQQHPKI